MNDADNRHRKYIYDICTAVDSLKIGILLDRMVDDGLINLNTHHILDLQANLLRHSILEAYAAATGHDHAVNSMTHPPHQRMYPKGKSDPFHSAYMLRKQLEGIAGFHSAGWDFHDALVVRVTDRTNINYETDIPSTFGGHPVIVKDMEEE